MQIHHRQIRRSGIRAANVADNINMGKSSGDDGPNDIDGPLDSGLSVGQDRSRVFELVADVSVSGFTSTRLIRAQDREAAERYGY